MRPRSLLVLLVVVLALGAVLWFWERDLPGSDERAEQARKLLPGFEASSATAVSVETAGRRVRLVRSGGAGDGEGKGGEAKGDAGAASGADQAAEWRFTEPAERAGERADAAAVDGLLSALGGIAKERELEDVEPAKVGLDAPRATLTVERSDGGAVELEVGADVPAAQTMVVRLGGDGAPDGGGVFLVDRALYRDLSRDEWRARDLFPYRRAEVEAITVDGPAGRVELVRHGGDAAAAGAEARFDVVAPYHDRADPDAVAALLGALTGLRVEAFRDGADPSALGLEPPHGAVEVRLAAADAASSGPFHGDVTAAEEAEVSPAADAANGPAAAAGSAAPMSFRVRLGTPGSDGLVPLAVGDEVVTARTPLGESVDRPPQAWASPRLTELRAFDLTGVRVEGPGGAEPLALERVDNDWQRDGASVDYTAVSDLLAALTEARADEVAPPAGALGAAQLTVHLHGGGAGRAEEQDTLTFHPAAAGRVPVTVAGRRARPVAVRRGRAAHPRRPRRGARRRGDPSGDPSGDSRRDSRRDPRRDPRRGRGSGRRRRLRLAPSGRGLHPSATTPASGRGGAIQLPWP